MVNMIEDLYYGNLDLAQMRPKKDSEYCKKHRQVTELLKKVDPHLNLVDTIQLEDTIIALEEIVSRSYFTIGFQWGARMVLSIFDSEPEAFGYQENDS